MDEEEFENIIVRAGEDGEITRLKDIARIELGSSQYALRSLLNNQPAVAIPIFQRPGSNAIAISDLVRERMAELFPRARLVRFKGVGHWVHSEVPELFVETVARFLDTVRAG